MRGKLKRRIEPKNPKKLAELKRGVLQGVLEIQEIQYEKKIVDKKLTSELLKDIRKRNWNRGEELKTRLKNLDNQLKQQKEKIWITILPYLKGTIKLEFGYCLGRNGHSLNELVNEAYLAIASSVNKFEWRRNRDALGYLMEGVKFRVSCYFDRQSHLRSYGRQILQKKMEIKARLRQELGREPSEEEILQRAQGKEYTQGRKLTQKVLQSLSEVQRAQPKSLESKVTSNDTRSLGSLVADTKSLDPERLAGLKEILDKILPRLKPIERKVFVEHALNEKTFEDIGKNLTNQRQKNQAGVCRERVRQLWNRAIEKVRQVAQEIELSPDLLRE